MTITTIMLSAAMLLGSCYTGSTTGCPPEHEQSGLPVTEGIHQGFNYWAHITGRDKVILDGDFLRLNRYDTDAERQTAVTLQLMAGGPVAVADQPQTIGDNLQFYTNSELLALRRDGFVGQPLNDRLGQQHETWYGAMSDGSYVVALFNRSDVQTTLTADFAQLGIKGRWQVRDLWTHTDEGTGQTSVTADVAAHGCKVVKLSRIR